MARHKQRAEGWDTNHAKQNTKAIGMGRFLDLVCGREYAGPHDYPVLRKRYSLWRSTGYERGEPSSRKWWMRKYRLGKYVLTVARTHEQYPHNEAKPRWSFAFQHKNLEHDPYWREEEFSRIKTGWESS